MRWNLMLQIIIEKTKSSKIPALKEKSMTTKYD